MRNRRGAYRVLTRHLREIDHLEDLGVDGRIILRWIFKKWDVGACTGSIWLRIGTGGGRCKCGNEPLGFTPYAELLD
jgi:hypothetical protein